MHAFSFTVRVTCVSAKRRWIERMRWIESERERRRPGKVREEKPHIYCYTANLVQGHSKRQTQLSFQFILWATNTSSIYYHPNNCHMLCHCFNRSKSMNLYYTEVFLYYIDSRWSCINVCKPSILWYVFITTWLNKLNANKQFRCTEFK